MSLTRFAAGGLMAALMVAPATAAADDEGGPPASAPAEAPESAPASAPAESAPASMPAGPETTPAAEPGTGKPEKKKAKKFSPDGRLEVVPLLGWIFFARAIALESGFYYGGELAHHFHIDHPIISLGAYTTVEGTLSNVIKTDRDVDVIIASGGVTLGFRGLGRVLPLLRGGAGFILADGTPGGLNIVGRLQFHVGAGVRVYPLDWLVIRAETKAIIHENLQIGAGSGQLKDVIHWVLQLAVGIAR